MLKLNSLLRGIYDGLLKNYEKQLFELILPLLQDIVVTGVRYRLTYNHNYFIYIYVFRYAPRKSAKRANKSITSLR